MWWLPSCGRCASRYGALTTGRVCFFMDILNRKALSQSRSRTTAAFGAAVLALAMTLGNAGGIAAADTVLDTTIPVAAQARGVAISPDGSRAYVAHETYPGALLVIDTATNAVIGNPIEVGSRSVGMAFTPDGTRAYVTHDTIPGNVSVIDTATNAKVGEVAIPTYSNGVAFTPDGTRAYITAVEPAGVWVVDTATSTVIGGPIRIDGWPSGVAITPDGSRAYVSHETNSGYISVIDTASNTVVEEFTVGVRLRSVAITPDGSRAYVTHDTSPGKVSVIDLATKAVIEEIPVGAYLRGIAITPDGAHAYVVDSSRQLVSVIAIDKAPTLDGTPPTGAVNTPYTHTFTVTGQPAPTVTVTDGTLPDGLELSAAGVLSGTPTTAGSFTFSMTASNGFGTPAVLADVTIEVTQTPPPATGLLGSLENFGS
ncbi:hypothetical protein CJ178_19830 [Rhodococcus sp. ACPA4]|nr:hypothetical protein CJ178_19830 [Rhodococcus sp. ACPA4]